MREDVLHLPALYVLEFAGFENDEVGEMTHSYKYGNVIGEHSLK